MNPESSQSNFNRQPQPSAVEITPRVVPSPERTDGNSAEMYRSSERANERQPVQGERINAPSQAMPSAMPMAVPPVQTQTKSSVISDEDNPAVAADEALIEKEWVDRAKKIIASTRDDPFMREQAIAQLRADYVYKRYGRHIAADSGD
ncbi:hypothetical protein FJZ39_01875 [Candidatus Saccharibacteria bacterium]|nr:hypothetical protein [Candidatus Saccharibacteria bacterium]